MLLFFVTCLDKTQKAAIVLILRLRQFHWEPGKGHKHSLSIFLRSIHVRDELIKITEKQVCSKSLWIWQSNGKRTGLDTKEPQRI